MKPVLVILSMHFIQGFVHGDHDRTENQMWTDLIVGRSCMIGCVLWGPLHLLYYYTILSD